jgi:nucleoid-associated protein YgaU
VTRSTRAAADAPDGRVQAATGGYDRRVTDRGLPVVDGAPACPFVAFADDRDARATSPDHRHRCYAETRPAPRALAHQEAYCLASAFPVCPTFQDWARREAATARSEPGSPAPATASRSAPATAAAAGATAASAGRTPDGENVAAPSFLASRDRPGSGLAGSPADRLASENAGAAAGEDEPGAADRAKTPEPPTRPQGAGPAMAAGAGAGSPGAVGSAGAAAAGAGIAAAAASGAGDGTPGASRDAGTWLDDEVERQDASWDRRPSTPQDASRPPSRTRREPNPAPTYERPRRESFPTRRTRTRFRNLSPLALAAIGVLALALLLFLAPGFLRGIGSGSPGASQVAGATGSPSAAASTSPSPSPSPTPAASTYVVQPGDTLSQIAQRFDISLDELIAANEENLPDPNNLQIGDELIIPSSGASSDDASPAASGGSASQLP